MPRSSSWRRGTKEGFAVDYIRTTDPITDDYLAQHKLFVQLNYPPYQWTPVAEAAFEKAMEQGTIGYIGFHHATLLGKFDGFEMSPFFHEFMGRIRARNVYFQFGHHGELLDNVNFQELFLNAIHWAAK